MTSNLVSVETGHAIDFAIAEFAIITVTPTAFTTWPPTGEEIVTRARYTGTLETIKALQSHAARSGMFYSEVSAV